ncbi:MAG TPA: DotU family type IV/VI secretion system protein [Polyangiaceae bacterium]|nr:DotU family type IV/VI secretion system protein [Polyangiaceae bacterium]
MSDVIYWLSADVLIVASELASSDLPAPAELRQQLLGLLERMVGAGRAAGVSDADIAEARYALVAFLDEQVLKSSWAGRTEWMNQPLQLLLYREYTAGENFFARMRALLQLGGRSAALQVYYLCLLLGFRGMFATPDREPQRVSFIEGAHQQLLRELPSASKISPHAQPPERAGASPASRAPFFAALALCALIVAGTLGGLAWSLDANTERAIGGLSSGVVKR